MTDHRPRAMDHQGAHIAIAVVLLQAQHRRFTARARSGQSRRLVKVQSDVSQEVAKARPEHLHMTVLTGTAVERLRLVDDVVDRSLLHFPFAGLVVVTGQGEAMPILIVQLWMIRPVVITRPPGFRAEHGVVSHGL